MPHGALQAKTQRQRANALFLEGRKLYSKGNYSGALMRFRRANRLFSSYKIDVSIGFCLDVLQRSPEAAPFFERFLAHRQSKENPALLKRVRSRLKKIRSILGTITLSTKTRGAIVTVDGKPVGETPLRHRIYLPPGTYFLKVEKAGRQLMAKSITLEVGEHYWDTVEGARGTVPLYYKRPRKYGAGQVEPPPPEIPDEIPWYKEWWVWAIVGGAVAGTVAVVVIANNVGGSDRLPQGDFPPVKLAE